MVTGAEGGPVIAEGGPVIARGTYALLLVVLIEPSAARVWLLRLVGLLPLRRRLLLVPSAGSHWYNLGARRSTRQLFPAGCSYTDA